MSSRLLLCALSAIITAHTHTDTVLVLSTWQLSCWVSPVRQDTCKASEQPRLPPPPWLACFSPGSLCGEITNACFQQSLTTGELICTVLFALSPCSESAAQAAVAKS